MQIARVGATTLPLKIYSVIKLVVRPEINAVYTVLVLASFKLQRILESRWPSRIMEYVNISDRDDMVKVKVKDGIYGYTTVIRTKRLDKDKVEVRIASPCEMVKKMGKDVPLDKFVEEQIKTNSDIVCLSAMMTTTMAGMKKAIEKLRAKNPNVKIMIGGAPVTGKIAEMWGGRQLCPRCLKRPERGHKDGC